MRRALFALTLSLLLYAAITGTAKSEDEEAPRHVPSVRGGRAAVEELATLYFPPESVAWAVRTASCETGQTFDLYAHSSGWDRRFGWYEHIGPWQLSVPTWAAKAWELFGGSLWSPEVNAQMAAWILVQYGAGHWPVCGR